MQNKNQKEENKILNCICEVNIDGKMALVSLYDDLPHFEYDLTIDNLKNSVTKLKTFVQELKQRITKLENDNTHLKTVNNVLTKNITSLYKTASIEIQRKDKIIDDLRKSQIVPLPSTSKMFSSTKSFQIENTEVNVLSESKKNTEKIENTIENIKVQNPNNNNDNITTIVIKPNHDIPKTVYYKRMCQKLAQQNYTIESNNQMEQIENTNTADKITQDKDEELNNDENALKEISTSLIHNESNDIINSTLVIFEPDTTPSDHEYKHDSTQVIQCDNQEKNKENVSIDSFFSKLKQPAKLKKKLIITPATIGVQNTHTKTSKCAKEINQINGLASITQSEITNSPEKPITKSLNKETLLPSIRNNFSKCDAKIEDKLFTTDILHNQQLLTSEKNNQTQSISIEVEQFPIKRKKKVIEKDSNTLALINMKKRSQITVTCLDPSNDNAFNQSIKNVKCLSTNNDKESSSQQKNDKSKCKLDILDCANTTSESKHLNNSCKSSSKITSIETSPANKSVLSSTNIENNQVPITRKTNALKRNNNTLNKSNEVTQESCITDNKNKYDSNTDDKQLSTDTLHNQKLSTYGNKKQILSNNIEVEQVPTIRKIKVLENDNNTANRFKKITQETCIKSHKNKNDSKTDDKQLLKDIHCNQKLPTCEKINQTQVSSINIEVEQFPIRRRKTVIEKDSNCIDVSDVRKRSCVTFINSSIDNDFNKSTENVKLLSMNNDKEPSSPSQQKNNQLKCNLDTLKCANSITDSNHINNSCKSSSENSSIDTSPTNKTVIPSINIEVEQGFVFRHSNRRKVIMRSTSDNKQEIKKGRHVQLITIKDHYSKPAPSFNGAKKTEIDVSKKYFLTEKVVESSSHFYVPQVKRRRTMNFGSADS